VLYDDAAGSTPGTEIEMDDWYSVLQVSPGADQDVIETAHRWLAQRYDPANDPSDEAAENLRKVDEAFAVLSDPERRSAYDASRGISAPAPTTALEELAPAAPGAVAPEASKAGESRAASVMLGVIVAVTFIVGIGVALAAAISDRGGTDYNPNRGDGDYDLEHMALTEADMPAGIEFAGSGDFSAEEWASLFDVVDEDELAAKISQLEAQGWVKNYVAEGGRPGFAKLLGVKSVSTLYTNEAAANEAATRFACGLPIELSEQLEEFRVPSIGEQSVGFNHRRPLRDDNGEIVITFVDTTVCFRTGRIVHAVQQTALEGVEDIAGSIRTAYVLLDHVNDAYEGKTGADGEDEEEG